jgi:hypothetical protein
LPPAGEQFGRTGEGIMARLLKDTFAAWISRLPPGPPKLSVTGAIEVPTGGYSAKLVRAVPQGINPAILLLDVQVTKPTGNVIQVISRVDLRFEESPPLVKYASVTVRLGSDTVTVNVTETS